MKLKIGRNASDSGLRFGLSQLLIAITALASPLALLSKYWASVSNTVDERTIPFSNANTLVQSYLIAGVTLVGILALAFSAVLLKRKLHTTATIFVLALSIVAWPAYLQIESKLISPARGNPTAEIHNDAAAILATAVNRFYSRTEKWPQSWDDLDDDINGVIAMLKTGKPKVAKPLAAFDPLSNDPVTREESQSIFSRAPDLNALTAQKLRGLVDIDFDADPRVLAKSNWMNFGGIVPHKPSYNMYRVEFGKLIARLNEPSRRSEISKEQAE